MRNNRLDSPRIGSIAMSALAIALLLTALGIGLLGILHSSTSTSSLPAPVGQNCGTLDTSDPAAAVTGDMVAYSAVPANCLWNAFQQCQTATLTFIEDGLDAGLTHIIIVRREDHGCSVSDSVRHYNDERVDYASYTCAGIRPLSGGVFTIYGCGDEGDLKIYRLG